MRTPLAALAFAAAALAVAQPPADPPAADKPATPKAADKPADKPAGKAKVAVDRLPEFEVQMADGSSVLMIVSDPTLTVQTKYGTLTVPTRDVIKVEFGFRYPDGVEAKIEAAVADLGSPTFQTREAAEKTLLTLAELAVPAVRQAVKSTDAEVARRAEAVLTKLVKAVPAEKLQPGREQDSVETTEFALRGRITNPSLKARTKYFGDAVLQLAEARKMTSASAGGPEFSLNAAEYAKPGSPNWYDTKLDVAEGKPLEIVCTGQIDTWPQEPGRYMCGPNGSRYSSAMMGSMPPSVARSAVMIQSPGAVIGRIGPAGTPFFVGASYKVAKAPAGGRLYLQIQPGQWGGDSAGSYKVKVTGVE